MDRRAVLGAEVASILVAAADHASDLALLATAGGPASRETGRLRRLVSERRPAWSR